VIHFRYDPYAKRLFQTEYDRFIELDNWFWLLVKSFCLSQMLPKIDIFLKIDQERIVQN
jgi:hypothetical protein